jgi:hypothetical protein
MYLTRKSVLGLCLGLQKKSGWCLVETEDLGSDTKMMQGFCRWQVRLKKKENEMAKLY